MKKQILYAKFFVRMFSTMIDFTILIFLMTPFSGIISRYSFSYVFADFISKHNLDIQNNESLVHAVTMPEFMQTITLTSFGMHIAVLMVFNILFMSIYFVLFWHYFSATPGKILMRIRVVDVVSCNKPTMIQAIKRFLGCLLSFVGIWFIFTNKERRALHDKLSNTMVIKV